MTVYVIIKQGVYRHECAGVFSTLDNAKVAANIVASNDTDSYHEYVVVPFILDTQTKQNLLERRFGYSGNPEIWYTSGGDLVENEPVYTVKSINQRSGTRSDLERLTGGNG